MLKKTLIFFIIFLTFGCSINNINNLTIEEIIDNQILVDNINTSVNRIGYKYYLPQEFNIKLDNGFVQELMSNNDIYYLNVDIISYYYKNNITTNHDFDDYVYYEFSNNENSGYLKITKNNKDFFIELCYNYAIIEVEVEESKLRYAISRSIAILNSIKYNDLVIENYITDNDVDLSETIYEIPEPDNKDSSKNVLEYIEQNVDKNTDDE